MQIWSQQPVEWIGATSELTNGKQNDIELPGCPGRVEDTLNIGPDCCIALDALDFSFLDILLDFSIGIEDRRVP